MVDVWQPQGTHIDDTIRSADEIGEYLADLEGTTHVTTLGGAEVLGVEDKFGSISEGKFADMIVLNQNLFEIEPNDIFGTEVESTILNGDVVYSRKSQGEIELELDDSGMAMHH